MAETISWVATVATVIAASLTAANLGSRITGIGFAIFTLGALCWITAGLLTHQPALMWTNLVLTILDIFGVWRWLGRQTKVEEGGRSAAEESQRRPGESLFPVSLLTSAPVFAGSTELGRCVDAMAGRSSGRLRYVVVSEGGLAGVGERLRRLPWTNAGVDGERLVAAMTRREFEGLEEVQRDEWPAR